MLSRDLSAYPRRPDRLPGLVRLSAGVRADAAAWRDAAPEWRHRTLLEAHRLLAPHEVLLGPSAAIVLGFPVVGLDLRQVVVLRHETGTARSTLVRRRRRSGLGEPIMREGVLVSTVPDTLVDLACWGGLVTGVCAMDAALHAGRCTREELRVALTTAARRRRGIVAARTAVGLADGRSESPGESLSRVRMWQARLPRPELQHELRAAGSWRRLDFFWSDHGVVGEHDGVLKYLADEHGEDPAGVLWREKLRQEGIQEALGATVVRWGWSEAWSHHGAALVRRLLRAGLPTLDEPWALAETG